MPSTSYETFNAAARAIGARTDAAGTAVEDMSAAEDRLANLLRTGFITHDAFVVAASTGMTLTVGSGEARRDEYAVRGADPGQGTYLVRLEVGSMSVTLDAADPGSARTDAIYLVVTDAAYDGGTLSLVRLAVRKGDVGAGAPGPDAGWSAYALLATVNVPAGATTISAGDVTDQRAPSTHRAGVPVGQLTMFAGADAPPGWLLCQGQAVSRTTYAALFAVLGTTYGAGDGSTTFNVPDMRGRFPIGAGSLGTDTYARGGAGGEARHALTTAELAGHTHTGPSHSHGSGTLATNSDSHSHTANSAGSHTHSEEGVVSVTNSQTGSSSLYLLDSQTNSTGSGGAHTHSTTSDAHTHSVTSGSTGNGGTGNTGSTGSGTAHENRPPYLGVNFLIYAGA